MTTEHSEPDERDLPDKPPIEDMPGEAGDPPPAEEESGETTFMPREDAAADPTVDDTEAD